MSEDSWSSAVLCVLIPGAAIFFAVAAVTEANGVAEAVVSAGLFVTAALLAVARAVCRLAKTLSARDGQTALPAEPQKDA